MGTEPLSKSNETPAVRSPGESLAEQYAPGKDVPLAGYATLMAMFGTTLLALLACRKTRDAAPERISAADIALLGAATHRLTRVVAKDWVTAPVRAPFTRFVESEGGGEVQEQARGTGLRKAVGELLTCRFCLGPWIAMGLVSGLVLRPRLTRMVATLFAVSGVSDFVHQAYSKVKK